MSDSLLSAFNDNSVNDNENLFKLHELVSKIGLNNLNIQNLEKKSVICFFEGAKGDSAFYFNFIKKIYGNEFRIFTFICKNKQNVISIISLLTANISIFNDFNKENGINIKRNIQVLLFIDKDFDDIVDIQNHLKRKEIPFFFQTQFYSIENYLVNKSVFKSVFHQVRNYKESKLDGDYFVENDFDYDKLIDTFETEFINFAKSLSIITSLIIIDRAKQKLLKLDEVQINKIIDFKLVNKIPKLTNVSKTQDKKESLTRYSLLTEEEKMKLKNLIDQNEFNEINKEINRLSQKYSKKEILENSEDLTDTLRYMCIDVFLNNISKSDWDAFPNEIKKSLTNDNLLFDDFKKNRREYHIKLEKDEKSEYLEKIKKLLFSEVSSITNYNSIISIINKGINISAPNDILKYLRGKYAVKYFISYYRALKEDYKLPDINEGSFIKIITPFLDIPEDLKLFLNENKKRFNEAIL